MGKYKITKIQTPSAMFLRTKIILPETKGKIIERSRLLVLLNNNKDKEIIFIIAGAGYGKTTLLSQWVNNIACTNVFYALSEEDSSLDLFLIHLIAGFDQLEQNFLKRTKELVTYNKELKNNIGTVMGTLVNELQDKCKKDYYIILDDYHAITASSVVHEALHYFIDHLPTKLHIIIASRVLPSFPALIKWRSKQRVFELGHQDLCFNSREIKQLISDTYGLSLPHIELQRIVQYTEGWVTGIQLILQSSGLHRTAIKDTLNGYLEAHQPLFDYFASEVLSYEPQYIQDFLIQSSVLEILTPHACNMILRRKNSHTLLKALEHRHLFLYEVEDQRYKFHHLFRKFLNQRLRMFKGYRQLHIRAAQYYRKSNHYELSIKHYLSAKDYPQAGKMILRSIQEDITGRISGGIDTTLLRKYLYEIPQRVLQKLPQLLVIKGTLQRDAGDHEAAKELYRTAEQVSRRSNDMTTCAHGLSELALLHWLQGKHNEALKILKKALRTCPGSELKMKLHILNLLGLAWQDLSNLTKAKSYLRQAKKIAEELNIFYNKIVLESNLATIFLQEGEIRRAYNTCKPLIPQLGERYYYKVGVIYANSARAALDFGDLNWAESCLEKGWKICRPYEDRVSFGILNHCFGLLHMHKQQWNIARKHLEEARKVFQMLRWKRMESSVLRNIGTLQRLQGDIPKSLQSIKQARGLLSGLGPGESAHATFLLADWALLEVELGKYSKARKTIAMCQRQARLMNWHLGELYALLVNTLISLTHKQKKESVQMIDLLIKLAQKKGCHGILSMELRHQPDLVKYIRQLPKYSSYLDKYHVYCAAEHPALCVKLFGRMRIEDSEDQNIVLNWPTEKTKSLFAFLVVHRTKGLSRGQVLDALWSRLSKKKAQENLRTTAYRMRRTIRIACIKGVTKELIFTSRQGRYVLLPNITIESDLDEFDRLTKLADIAHSDDETKTALKKAIDITQADFLPDIYDHWVDSQRSMLRARKLNALQKIIQIISVQNDYHACIGYCKQYLAMEPLSEEIACICMKSLKKLDRMSEIRIVYQSLKKALRNEVKCTPTQETQRLFQTLLKKDIKKTV
ncbi:MAG: BTAD domain-containing putative transcriptional regulator [bacterium]